MTTQAINRPSIQSLKHKAKALADKEKIALNRALNLIANDYGFTHWALLMKHYNMVRLNDPATIWRSFYSGEMMLLSALEGAGKLSLALNLACIALQENIIVNYITVHNNRNLVNERFEIIFSKIDDDFKNNFKIIDIESNENTILNNLKLTEHNTFVIIDYMQAIEYQYTSYEVFLRNLKEITNERNLRLLILSQATKDGNIQLSDQDDSKKVLRHFSHYLQLNHADNHQTNKRELILIKSTHYQCHETLLSLSKKTFIFSMSHATMCE